MKDMVRYGRLLDFYSGVLTQKQRDVLELYYGSDLTLEEIAQNCGISKQAVHDSVKSAEGKMNRLEEKLGLLNRRSLLEQKLKLSLKNLEQGEVSAAEELLREIINEF